MIEVVLAKMYGNDSISGSPICEFAMITDDNVDQNRNGRVILLSKVFGHPRTLLVAAGQLCNFQ